MPYALTLVTKDQMAKTAAKVLCERFISVFGTPAKSLSDHRVNFTSVLVELYSEMPNHGIPCAMQWAS